MAADTGCNLHGWAFTHGCPGCDEADDRAIVRELRWPMFKSEWLPYRVCEFLPTPTGDIEAALTGNEYDNDLLFGPYHWMAPRRGPFASRPAVLVLGFLNKRGWA